MEIPIFELAKFSLTGEDYRISTSTCCLCFQKSAFRSGYIYKLSKCTF